MDFNQIINSPLLYAVVIIGLLLVLGYTVLFLRKGLQRCHELQIEQSTVRSVITSSLVYSVVPSISIVVGLATMTIALGIALPWWRLSVMGSLGYEMAAASMAALFMGFDSLGSMAATGDPSYFVAVFMVMSLGLVIPMILLILLGKKVSLDMINAKNSKDKTKSDWSVVLSKTILMTLMSCFIPIMLFTEKVYGLTFAVSILLTIVFDFLTKKKALAWLENFSLAFVLLISLAASVGLYNAFN